MWLTACLCAGERGHHESEQGKAADSDRRGETITPSLTRPFPTFLPPRVTGCCRPLPGRAPALGPRDRDQILLLILLKEHSTNFTCRSQSRPATFGQSPVMSSSVPVRWGLVSQTCVVLLPRRVLLQEAFPPCLEERPSLMESISLSDDT